MVSEVDHSMADKVVEQIVAARRVSTPLVALETPDQPATVTRIAVALNGSGPIVRWDLVRGFKGLNKPAMKMVAAKVPQPLAPGMPTPDLNPTQALGIALDFEQDSVVFMMNAHRILDDPTVVQGIMNIRDEYKQNGRMIVLLGPSFKLPTELAYDVVTMEEPLPAEAEITQIVTSCIEDARANEPAVPVPDAQTLTKAVGALSGLTAFAAEQAAAMSITTEGLTVAELWRLKRRMVNATSGLKMENPSFTFDDIGGLDRARWFGEQLNNGNTPPKVYVRVDEIEKMLGATGAGESGAADSSGVQGDALGVVLREMEDNGWTGLVAVGPAGSGKTLYSTALGASFGRPTCAMDFGAMRDKWVGSSEQRVREVMRILKAIGGSDVFFVATCNRLDALPPELKRRFKCGIWFFDLPTEEERERIWVLQAKRYNLTPEQFESRKQLDATGWTGAEIRIVCEMAYRFNSSIPEAATTIVPVATQDPEGIERLRKLAHNRFLSANYAGKYQNPAMTAAEAGTTGRSRRRVGVAPAAEDGWDKVAKS
jgi:ATP-dependent 26S proteasome regulatory subunit